MSEAAIPAGRRTRSGARRLALEILYQADLTARSPSDVLAGLTATGRRVPPFTRELVTGVEEHRPDLDTLLARHVRGWTIDRLAAVDRNVLRLAVFELLHRADVPPAAAISEAVQTAKALSTEQSGRFVNGILGAIAKELAAGER